MGKGQIGVGVYLYGSKGALLGRLAEKRVALSVELDRRNFSCVALRIGCCFGLVVLFEG